MSAVGGTARGRIWPGYVAFGVAAIVLFAYFIVLVLPVSAFLARSGTFEAGEDLGAFIIVLCVAGVALTGALQRWLWRALSRNAEQRRADTIRWHELFGPTWMGRRLRSMTVDEFEARERRDARIGMLLTAAAMVLAPAAFLLDRIELVLPIFAIIVISFIWDWLESPPSIGR